MKAARFLRTRRRLLAPPLLAGTRTSRRCWPTAFTYERTMLQSSSTSSLEGQMHLEKPGSPYPCSNIGQAVRAAGGGGARQAQHTRPSISPPAILKSIATIHSIYSAPCSAAALRTSQSRLLGDSPGLVWAAPAPQKIFLKSLSEKEICSGLRSRDRARAVPDIGGGRRVTPLRHTLCCPVCSNREGAAF